MDETSPCPFKLAHLSPFPHFITTATAELSACNISPTTSSPPSPTPPRRRRPAREPPRPCRQRALRGRLVFLLSNGHVVCVVDGRRPQRYKIGGRHLWGDQRVGRVGFRVPALSQERSLLGSELRQPFLSAALLLLLLLLPLLLLLLIIFLAGKVLERRLLCAQRRLANGPCFIGGLTSVFLVFDLTGLLAQIAGVELLLSQFLPSPAPGRGGGRLGGCDALASGDGRAVWRAQR